MSEGNPNLHVVYTNKAHCRDCYRCLRVCPVKAIRMENGQAYVVPERCIACGTCVRECPQGAKQFRNDVEKAARLLASGGTAAASIAPSFVAVFSEWEQKRLPSALRKLGFSYIGETALGAYHVADETAKIVAAEKDQSHVCTSCPAVVSYVERYQPECLDLLVPVVSPMLAHAKHIRATLGEDTKIVFIGPCVAKKAEAERSENRGLVDCVLTFVELKEWMERECIELSTCEESRFSEEPGGDARFFPIVGGSVRTAGLSTDLMAAGVISVSGADEVKEALANALTSTTPQLVEPLFCPQGCVNGPAMPREGNLYERRRDVLEYAESNPGREAAEDEGTQANALFASFLPSKVHDRSEISEEQIREVLDKTGKASPENQLNCGACGYPSCRDKAIAVIEGMAELEMCIPYMKRLAEQRTDKIIETSPNGIVILDDKLQIMSMNNAFKSFFMCSDAVLGRPVSYLMDPDPFEKLASGSTDLVETVVRHDRYNLVCHEILYALPEEKQFVGILVNITNNRAHKEKLDQLRSQTLTQARELLDHQINMAQTMAKFLGESTAQSEGLLDRLMLLAGDNSGDEGGDSIWDTYTSK